MLNFFHLRLRYLKLNCFVQENGGWSWPTSDCRWNHLGVDDGIIHLLQRAQSHLDCSGSAVRTTIFVSSAFNAIQPSSWWEAASDGVDASTTSWTTDSETDRPQFVRLADVLSETVDSSPGAPQGTVLSPVLFSWSTSDFQYNSSSCHYRSFQSAQRWWGTWRMDERTSTQQWGRFGGLVW